MEDVSECFDSVVQVLNVKKIASTDTTAVDRYRCVNSIISFNVFILMT